MRLSALFCEICGNKKENLHCKLTSSSISIEITTSVFLKKISFRLSDCDAQSPNLQDY